MIKNVLLPEQFGSYYLFPKRIVGFEISSTHVFASVCYLQGTTIVIENCIEVGIEQDNGQELAERTAQAIKKVLHTVGKFSAIYTGISSSHVVFKTMKLPFGDTQKIKRVIDFEVEPLLPFSIADAVVDFIVIGQNIEEKSSEVLVAAVQKQYISQTLELFSKAGVQPEVITIDMFELYGFYQMIPYYRELSGGVTLLEINSTLTKIAYILDGQLRFIRTLPSGTTHIAQSVAHTLSISTQEAHDNLMNSGFKQDDPTYVAALNKAAESFATKLRFTLQSFTVQTEPEEQLTHMALLGLGANIKGLDQWLNTELNIPCAVFNADAITEHPQISLKNMAHIPVENTVSASIALPSPTTAHFNLRQKEFAQSDDKLMLKQLIVTGLLLLMLFGGLLLHSFFQARMLRNELEASRSEASDVLNDWFPTIESGYIDDMIEEADRETKNEEKLWFAFGRSSRNSMLNLLLELTNLDREGLGLIIEKVTIDQDRGIMMLKAQVKDDEALKLLENELRQSKVFTYFKPQDFPKFDMELRFKTGPEGDS